MSRAFGAFADFFRREPARLLFLVRLAFYLVLGARGLTVLEPETLATLLFGVIGVDLAGTETARSKTVPTITLDEAQGLSSMGEVGAFAVAALRGLVPLFLPGATLAKAISVIAPFIEPIASQTLTPAIQQDVTSRIHEALRSANLLRRVNL